MGINSNRNGSASAVFLISVVTAALLMIVMLSILAGMLMGIETFGNYLLCAMSSGVCATVILLALLFDPTI